LEVSIAWCGSGTFGDAPESGEGTRGHGLRAGKLFLVEKFGEVEDFVDLVFREGLDQLVKFFGGCHNFSGVNGFVLLLWRKGLGLRFSFIRIFRLLGGHFGVLLKQFFEACGATPVSILSEAATDLDAFEDFIVTIVDGPH
jgi:hypothetical protein